MFQHKRILAMIPARAGSKGIKNKNIIALCGKPLISYTITAAKESKYIDEVVVSTDSESIAAVARQYGASVPFLRPAELASDTAKTIDAVLHTVSMLPDYDILVLLQPTQPLRTSADIDGAIETFFAQGQQALASVSEVDDHPLLIRQISQEGLLVNLLNNSSTCRRQDMPAYYRINGAIYINSCDYLTAQTSFNDNPVPYIMAKSHSVDIDDIVDLSVAEFYLLMEGNA